MNLDINGLIETIEEFESIEEPDRPMESLYNFSVWSPRHFGLQSVFDFPVNTVN